VPIAWGCDLVLLYADYDHDGFGSSQYGISGGCEAREGWSDVDGDCNENSATVFPGAEEVCNERDDNCNGEIDEGTELRPLYVDADGDGYGVPGESILGCAAEPGYSDVDTDCDDNDPTNAPGFEEICDGHDNDCDGRTDEDVLARCGTGWCERLARSCDPDSCVPGEPSPERCNAIDDDCDGVIDNDASGCEAGLVCLLGVCLPPEDADVVAALPPDESPMPVAMPAATPVATSATNPVQMPVSATADPATAPVGPSAGTAPPATTEGPAALPNTSDAANAAQGSETGGVQAPAIGAAPTSSGCGLARSRSDFGAWPWLAFLGWLWRRRHEERQWAARS
jgi:hypothetical protein